MNTSTSAGAWRRYGLARGKLIVRMRERRAAEAPNPTNWRDWMRVLFPKYLRPPYALYHVEFWEWLWSIVRGETTSPFVGVWPRGFAKSTSAEVGCACLAARGTRRYVLYVCATQEQANDHVGNIAAILESPEFEQHFPATSRRALTKYGHSKAWRRNRLRTDDGFVCDAIGLDTASRGVKIEGQRPDFLLFDDIDELQDTSDATKKKMETIQKSILPAGSSDAAVCVMQNLMLEAGVIAQLVDGTAEILQDRIVSGPHPAVEGLAIDTDPEDHKSYISAGTTTWGGKPIAALQAELTRVGPTAFLSELQHQTLSGKRSMFAGLTYLHIEAEDLPELEDVQVWVDPAVTDTKQSDCNAIQVDAFGVDGKLYRLESWEERSTPEATLERAINAAIRHHATCVGVETDQGGDTWLSVYKQAWRHLCDKFPELEEAEPPPFRQAKAGSIGSKSYRAQQMLSAYERAEIIHVLGPHAIIEKRLGKYLIEKPFDLVDASFWSWWGCTRARGVVEIH